MRSIFISPISPDVSSLLQPLVRCHFSIKNYGNCSDVLSSLIPRLYEFKRSTRLKGWSLHLIVGINRYNCMFYASGFLFTLFMFRLLSPYLFLHCFRRTAQNISRQNLDTKSGIYDLNPLFNLQLSVVLVPFSTSSSYSLYQLLL